MLLPSPAPHTGHNSPAKILMIDFFKRFKKSAAPGGPEQHEKPQKDRKKLWKVKTFVFAVYDVATDKVSPDQVVNDFCMKHDVQGVSNTHSGKWLVYRVSYLEKV